MLEFEAKYLKIKQDNENKLSIYYGKDRIGYTVKIGDENSIIVIGISENDYNTIKEKIIEKLNLKKIQLYQCIYSSKF